MARSRSPPRERHAGRRPDRDHDRKPYDRDRRRGDSRERRQYGTRDDRGGRYDDRGTGRDYQERRNYRPHSRERSTGRQDDRRAAPKPTYRPVYEDDAIPTRKQNPSRPLSTSRSPPSAKAAHNDRGYPEDSTAHGPEAGQPETTAEDDAEAQMAAMMGFGGFGTTKGAKVQGNVAGGIARPAKKVEYRQYMNRIGGFNRPISPS